MGWKKALKITVDSAMLGLYVYLMGYRYFRYLRNHALAGMTLCLLFLIHHWLNSGWIRVLFKGKYTGRRTALTAVNVFLTAAMAVILISSIMMAGAVFPLSVIPMSHLGYELHLSSTAWGFILTAFHLGFHTHSPLERLRRKLTGWQRRLWYLALGIFTGWGVWGFVRSGLWSDLFLLYAAKIPLGGLRQFCAAYAGILTAGCILVHFALLVLSRRVSRTTQISS